MKGHWIEVEPFDPAGPTLGHRRAMLNLHMSQVKALESLTTRTVEDEGLLRSLLYRLQCQIDREQNELARDEWAELARLAQFGVQP